MLSLYPCSLVLAVRSRWVRRGGVEKAYAWLEISWLPILAGHSPSQSCAAEAGTRWWEPIATFSGILLEMGDGGRIYATEFGKCYKFGLPFLFCFFFFFFPFVVIKLLPAHYWLIQYLSSPNLTILMQRKSQAREKKLLSLSTKSFPQTLGLLPQTLRQDSKSV